MWIRCGTLYVLLPELKECCNWICLFICHCIWMQNNWKKLLFNFDEVFWASTQYSLSFVISVIHQQEWVAPNIDISLQSGWFWAMSIASFIERLLLDFWSCWIFFIHVVQRCCGGLHQFSKGEAVKILASVSSGIWAMRLNTMLGQWT